MQDGSRREFIAKAVVYAAAVSPVTALAVQTSEADLTTGMTTVPVGKDKLPAFFAHPKKKGKFPCVLVVQEIFGIHEYIRDVCRRLAKEGYFAVAPALYFRQGDPTTIAEIKDIIEKIVSKVEQKQVLRDLDATVTWLEHQKVADAKRIGVTGFCWGGNVTWMYSSHNPKLKAGVAWYGKVVGSPTPTVPKFPADIAPTLTVPVLGLYGGRDKGISQEDVGKMREALEKGKSKSTIHVYPDAEHGFHADYRPSYNEVAAKDGWAKLLSWFKDHGL